MNERIEQKPDKWCEDVNSCKQKVMDREMKWICFSTSRRNELREISDRVEAGREFKFSRRAAEPNTKAAACFPTNVPFCCRPCAKSLQLGVSCHKLSLLTSSEGPDDMTAVTKCKGAALLSANPQKGRLVIYLLWHLSPCPNQNSDTSGNLQQKCVFWRTETREGRGGRGRQEVVAFLLRKSL